LKKNKKKRSRESLQGDGSYIKIYLEHLLHEGTLIFTLAAAIFLLLALCSYHRMDAGWSHTTEATIVFNSTGKVGAWIADLFLYFFGYPAYVFPLLLGYVGWHTYRLGRMECAKKSHRHYVLLFRTLGLIIILIASCALVSLHFKEPFSPLPYSTGGIVGTVVAHGFVHDFNVLGANLLVCALLLISITLFSGFSWMRLLEQLGGVTIKLVARLVSPLQKLLSAIPRLFQRKTSNPPKISSTKKVIESLDEEDDDEKSVSPAVLKREKEIVSAEIPFSTKPKINAPTRLELNEKMNENIRKHAAPSNNKLPNLSLLDAPSPDHQVVFDKKKLEEKSQEVELRLADFGVQAKVVAVHPGPVVTRYELQLAAGTKVSKITGLVKDLARSLSVISVRVVEVIPGKSVIGLELPNDSREVVNLQEVLASKQYQISRSALSLALGKDISGNPVVVDLGKMPHLLVAGTTGAGKSVCLNAMLLSLLYKSTPEQLRLILIDPKMLELSIYEGIPHLLAPVVTDMKDAATALRWCVIEMERRYRLMASLGVRNIAGYNLKVQEAQKRGQPLFDPLTANAENKVELTVLSNIVVIADEFADMMVVVGKKVETLIVRLAQKARAAGIHLIFATQRPSVDVITGLIKANIPTRIAFQVSSKIDSRTILDQQGAEQLLGQGDMLYLPPGSGVPIRVHGAYVSDDEVHRVVKDLQESGQPEYVAEILDDTVGTDASGYTTAALAGMDEDGEKDPLYDEAVEAVIRSRRVSVSSIQRRFKIGYNRAARIVESMEAAGVVSTMESNGNREVLVPPQD